MSLMPPSVADVPCRRLFREMGRRLVLREVMISRARRQFDGNHERGGGNRKVSEAVEARRRRENARARLSV